MSEHKQTPELKEIKKVEKILKKDYIFVWVIAFLLLVIAVMGFFLGRMTVTQWWTTWVVVNQFEELEIMVIADDRDVTSPLDQILTEIKSLPSIQKANIVQKEFNDAGVKEILEENNITTLPVFIFSTNNFDTSIDPQTVGQNGQMAPKINAYLQKLPKEGYMLPIGAQFNPFQERSARWNLMLDMSLVKQLQESGHNSWDTNAQILWVEYSDLECPFCAKFHNEGTIKQVTDKYPNDIQISFHHFPLNFHQNAQKAAEALECMAEQKWVEWYYSLIESSYTKYNNNNFNFDGFYELAADLGADVEVLKTCTDSGKYAQKVIDQMNFWAETFGITGTPGNALINLKTGEYAVISGAYPASQFEAVLEKIK